MTEYADLEIGLERRPDGYAVDLRLALPGSDADVQATAEGVRIAVDDLRQHAIDPRAYGRRLGQEFFAVPAVRDVLAKARALEHPLRVRLAIAPNAPELHRLRWEALADPERPDSEAPLLMGERVLFSRYLGSQDWRRVPPRPKGDLRALVVVANPADLASYAPGGRPLAAVDVAAEVARARAGLDGIEATILGETDRASLDNIVDRLLAGPDILYLVCHGALIDGSRASGSRTTPGPSAVTAGAELVTRLRELEQPPRLVALVSCQSAGTGEGEALARWGRNWAKSGVPAVLAMHGDVPWPRAEAFMPVFFRELQRDGVVDRAMAVARGAVRDRADAWAPVLYMRPEERPPLVPAGPRHGDARGGDARPDRASAGPRSPAPQPPCPANGADRPRRRARRAAGTADRSRSSAYHPDRSWRRWQDPPRRASRGRGAGSVPRRRLVGAAGQPSPIPKLVAQAIATPLGVREDSGEPLPETIGDTWARGDAPAARQLRARARGGAAGRQPPRGRAGTAGARDLARAVARARRARGAGPALAPAAGYEPGRSRSRPPKDRLPSSSSWSAPGRSSPGSPSTRATRRPSPRSAGGWTGCPWPSSWPPPASASCPRNNS